MATYTTGGDVDTSCTKCKLVLAHVIIAMDGAKIVRVECKTCRTVHAYKAASKSSTKAASARVGKTPAARSGAKTTRSVRAAEADYERLISGQDLSRALRYRPSVVFEEGSVVDHPTFGFGMVTRVMSDNKIDVVFQTGAKVLVHSR